MSIQLQGTAESTFANDVTIGDEKITLSGADGAATFGGTCSLIKKDSSLPVTAEALTWGINGDPTYGGYIAYDGTATFNGNIGLYAAASVSGPTRQLQGFSGGTPYWYIRVDGQAVFQTVEASNLNFSLDTGGTLDVKERLQNTRAVLLSIKTALTEATTDADTLRQKLLEALDILTLDGDES